ncbi:MAG: CoA transferase, partial [Anaerolineales bacterium]
AALFHRKQTGEGQHIDIALFDAQLGWLANVAHNYFATGTPPQRYGNAHPNIVPYETFPTANGHLAVAVGTDAQFERLCKAVGREDLGEDPRYLTLEIMRPLLNWRLVVFGLLLMLTLRFFQNGLLHPVLQFVLRREDVLAETVAKRELPGKDDPA